MIIREKLENIKKLIKRKRNEKTIELSTLENHGEQRMKEV